MASSAVVKGLQTAINRFYGVTLGAPIDVDGKLGPQTLGAIDGIVEWMPQAGYDTQLITSYIGGAKATTAYVANSAAEISNAIDWLADINAFETGVVPSPPSVPVAATAAGKVPASMLPRGPSQRATAGLLGLGLPDWAVYASGAGLAAVIALMIAKRKKPGSIAGAKENAYGLTFHRWWRAAGFNSQPAMTSKARDAWYRGEDPSDWRAEIQRQAHRAL